LSAPSAGATQLNRRLRRHRYRRYRLFLAPLPPNAGASMSPVDTTPMERVSAVVTGAHPFALLEEGSTARLLSIGDDHEGRRISAIDQNGVHLDDGTLLKLSPHPAFATPNLGGRRL
jgi:hypothetical protein